MSNRLIFALIPLLFSVPVGAQSRTAYMRCPPALRFAGTVNFPTEVRDWQQNIRYKAREGSCVGTIHTPVFLEFGQWQGTIDVEATVLARGQNPCPRLQTWNDVLILENNMATGKMKMESGSARISLDLMRDDSEGPLNWAVLMINNLNCEIHFEDP